MKPPPDPNSLALDVNGCAKAIDRTPSAVRHLVERGLIPHRKWNGKIIFLRTEVEAFLKKLPGCTLDEVQRNIEARNG